MAGDGGVAKGYFKGHGLGNDYLVFEEGADWILRPSAIERVCDRWRGVGSDGIVLRLTDPSADRTEAGERLFRLRMFNPDGSEFERSGNGLRILGSYLASRGEVDADPFVVEVGGSRVRMQVIGRKPDGTYDISVELGRARLGSDAVALDRRMLEGALPPGVGEESFEVVSVGNPHCVVFTDDHSERALREIGPALATHPAFRNGTNVQLARKIGRGRIRIGIWERGVGRTSASGTSSCAAAVAAVHRGLVVPGEVVVEMEGGTLFVTVTESLEVTLRGPVQEIGTGELAPGFLRFLAP